MQQCVAFKHWQHSACQTRVQRGKQVVTKASSVDSSLFKLPLFSSRYTAVHKAASAHLSALRSTHAIAPLAFKSRNALLPTESGRLHVYEPRYLEMFKKLQDEAAAGMRPESLRFGHIISPQDAPPLLLEEASIAGVPKVGVIANVRGVQTLGDGTLEVEYEGSRRFQILSMVDQEPYLVGYVMTISDSPASATPEQQACDAAELELYKGLQEVVRLSNQIAAETGEGVGGTLPPSVTKYAPVPTAPRRTFAQALIDSGYSAAGHSIALWQAQGSVYGTSQRQGRLESDPYTLAAGQILGHELRQELFSFAAAGVIDMGVPERLAILNSRDTLGRLQWLNKAVAPYLAELQAKAALSRALGTAADMTGTLEKPE